MFTYRSFRNSDPPHLARIWSSQPSQRALASPVSSSLLEESVFSKLSFEPDGLIVALKDQQIVGFSHAAIAPSSGGQTGEEMLGATYRIVVLPEHQQGELPRGLLARSEAYLTRAGAKVFYGGSVNPFHSYYLGLYGGSEVAGILDSDPFQQEVFTNAGYERSERFVVMQCDLPCARTPVSRGLMRWRRTCQIHQVELARGTNWHKKCDWAHTDTTRFELRNANQDAVAGLTVWDIEPLATTWGVRAAGILDLEVAADSRRSGAASCLLCESMRALGQMGYTLVEAQTNEENAAAIALYQKFQYEEVDRATLFRKPATA